MEACKSLDDYSTALEEQTVTHTKRVPPYRPIAFEELCNGALLLALLVRSLRVAFVILVLIVFLPIVSILEVYFVLSCRISCTCSSSGSVCIKVVFKWTSLAKKHSCGHLTTKFCRSQCRDVVQTTRRQDSIRYVHSTQFQPLQHLKSSKQSWYSAHKLNDPCKKSKIASSIHVQLDDTLTDN